MYEIEELRGSTYKVTDPASGASQVVAIPDGERIEDYFDQVFAAPAADSLEGAKQKRLSEINAAFERQISAIMTGCPRSEVLSWDKQESEARALVQDASAITPLLSALAAARGLDKSELAQRVIAKADLFAETAGGLLGKRQALEDRLSAMTDEAEIRTVKW